MQFAEVLTPDEIKSVERFIPEHSSKRRALRNRVAVISLSKTIEAGGYVPRTVGLVFKKALRLPRLAIGLPGVASDMHLWNDAGPTYHTITAKRSFRVETRVSWHTQYTGNWDSGVEYRAQPPPLPVEARRAIDEHHETALVLWEAKWEERRAALDDPAIIVPLIEDLYAVVYSWDLTPVERAALQKASA